MAERLRFTQFTHSTHSTHSMAVAACMNITNQTPAGPSANISHDQRFELGFTKTTDY
jgi:hypothetical protein